MAGLAEFKGKKASRSWLDTIPERDEAVEGFRNGLKPKEILDWLRAPVSDGGCGYSASEATYDRVRRYFWEGRHDR